MPPNNAPIFVKSANVIIQQFTDSDGQTAKTIHTAGAYGSKLFAIGVTSDYIGPVAMDLLLNNGGGDYLMGSIMVSAYAGTDASIPAQDILDMTLLEWLDATGEVFLPDGYSVKAKLQNTLGSGYTVNVIAYGGDY